jgi:drug/metabolite transporter (DMT)-like permease
VEEVTAPAAAGREDHTNRPALPYMALVFGVLALSLSSLFVRWSEAAGPVTSFYRMAIASLVLLPVIALRVQAANRPQPAGAIPQAAGPRRGLVRSPRWLLFPLLGGLFSALDHGTWSTAIQSTRIANATLLNNLAPLWVALFAALVWRERLAPRFWAGLLAALAGMSLVVGGDLLLAPGLNRGNALAVLSSLFYAGYFLITQRGRGGMDAITYVWAASASTGMFLLVFALAAGLPLRGFSPLTWLVFLLAALVSQVGGYFSIAYALGRLPASLVSPMMVAQPVLTALLALLLEGENLVVAQWAGVFAVVFGIYLVNNRRAAVGS